MIKKTYKVYTAHKSALEELKENVSETGLKRLNIVLNSSDIDNTYDCIKVNEINNTICLIYCEGFDRYYEPVIVRISTYTFDENNNVVSVFNKKYDKNGKVYHNKWQMVSNSYSGFNIQKSKERMDIIENTIPCFSRYKYSKTSGKVWRELMKEYNLPKYM